MFIMPEALELIRCFLPSAAASPPLLASDVPADMLCAGIKDDEGSRSGWYSQQTGVCCWIGIGQSRLVDTAST